MQTERHLEILRAEGALLASVPADALDAPVPSVDGWTAEVVLRHTGKVHRWVTAALALAPDDPMEATGPIESLPKGPAALDAYAESLATVVEALAGADPDRRVPGFTGPTDVAWWARRQAHEVTVHRVDAQDAVQAAGGPAPDRVTVDGAADGVDEWARVFLGLRFGQRYGAFPDALEGRSVHIHGTDDPAPADGAEWLLRFDPTGLAVERVHAKGDVALRGPVEDLLLALWRRRPLSTLDLVGDVAVAEALSESARF